MKVLLIDDDVALKRSITRVLASVGWIVDDAEPASLARGFADIEDVDVVVLDLGRLESDRLILLGRIRIWAHGVPVLATGAIDAIAAAATSADAYLQKPFSLDELVLRVSALFERKLGGRRLRLGNLVLDVIERSVRVDEQRLPMTPSHLSLLECLMRKPGDVVPFERIAQALYGVPEASPNSLQRHISELRRRLSRAGASATILSKRRRGYICADFPAPHT